MKKNWLLIGGVVLLLLAAVLMVSSSNSPADSSAHHNSTSVPAATAPHDHAAGASTQPIPAHFEVPPNKSSLGPTLAPDKFTGITRDAYRAVRCVLVFETTVKTLVAITSVAVAITRQLRNRHRYLAHRAIRVTSDAGKFIGRQCWSK